MGKRRKPRDSFVISGGKTADVIRTRNSARWRMAESEHAGLISSETMPILDNPPDALERARALRRILSGCPEYFPASLNLGYQMLCTAEGEKGMAEGRRRFRRGVQGLLALGDGKEIADNLREYRESLGERFLYEEAMALCRVAIERNAGLGEAHRGLGYSLAHLGDCEAAAREMALAAATEPGKAVHLADMAWVEAIRGNIQEAKALLKKALALDRAQESPRRELKRNLEAMEREGGPRDWGAFLLRGPDAGAVLELENNDDPEKRYDLTVAHNARLSLAFRMHLARRKDLAPARKFYLALCLDTFMEAAEKEKWPPFLHDMTAVRREFPHIMDLMIVTLSDFDGDALEGVCSALIELYRLLARDGAVSAAQFRLLKKRIRRLRPSIQDRMERYNRVRLDPMMTFEDRERTRDEIFGPWTGFH